MDQEWRFADPRNVAVFTVQQIMRQGKPILYVAHDEDGEWQFFSDEAPKEDDAMLVGLGTMVKLDPSIMELADLPIGWYAWRATATDSWVRQKRPS